MQKIMPKSCFFNKIASYFQFFFTRNFKNFVLGKQLGPPVSKWIYRPYYSSRIVWRLKKKFSKNFFENDQNYTQFNDFHLKFDQNRIEINNNLKLNYQNLDFDLGCLGGAGQLGELSSSGYPKQKVEDDLNLGNLQRVPSDDFVEDLACPGTPISENKLRMGIGIKPISNGVVVDHIASGDNAEAIWKQIDLVRTKIGQHKATI